MLIKHLSSFLSSDPIVSLLCALVPAIISGFFSYKLAVKRSSDEANRMGADQKNAIDRLIREQKLSIEREARLYGYAKKYDATADVSKKLARLVAKAGLLFPSGISFLPKDKNAREEYRITVLGDASSAYNDAQLSLRANAPFLSNEVSSQCSEILRSCLVQLNYFQSLCEYPDKAMYPKEKAFIQNEEITLQLNKALELMKQDLKSKTLLQELD